MHSLLSWLPPLVPLQFMPLSKLPNGPPTCLTHPAGQAGAGPGATKCGGQPALQLRAGAGEPQARWVLAGSCGGARLK